MGPSISFYHSTPPPLLNLTVFKSPRLSLAPGLPNLSAIPPATFTTCRKTRDRSPARGPLIGKIPSAERRRPQPRIPPVRLIVRTAVTASNHSAYPATLPGFHQNAREPITEGKVYIINIDPPTRRRKTSFCHAPAIKSNAYHVDCWETFLTNPEIESLRNKTQDVLCSQQWC